MLPNGFPRTFALYVDESGDPGVYSQTSLNTRHFILSGVIVPIDRWKNVFDQHRQIRYFLKQSYDLPVREEIHAGHWLGRNRSQLSFSSGLNTKFKRSLALKDYVQRIAVDLVDIQFIHIHVNKTTYIGTSPVDVMAWERLIQRFHNFLERQTSSGISNPAHGIVFADQNNEPMLRNLLRKMRAYNPVPSKYDGTARQILCTQIVDDPVIRDSAHSYFIQIADVAAHLLYQKLYPKGSLKRYNVDRLFDLLIPRLLLAASTRDSYQMGIVHI
jgi:hypothetical protein